MRKSTLELMSMQRAEKARLVNSQLIEVLSRPFPYKQPKDGEAGFDGWKREAEKKFSDRPHILEALRWLSQPIDEYGRDLDSIIPRLRSLLPILYAAEQQDLSWVYVGTVASVFPMIHLFWEILIGVVLLYGGDDNVPGSWANQFDKVRTAAEAIYMAYYRERRVSDR